MDNLTFFNDYSEAVCAFSSDKKIVFKNKAFQFLFPDCTSVDKFKKCFNFNLCFLSLENIKNKTPIDLLLQSKENFHTFCSYQNVNEEYINYYIYTFKFDKYVIAVFKDVTSERSIRSTSLSNHHYSPTP